MPRSTMTSPQELHEHLLEPFPEQGEWSEEEYLAHTDTCRQLVEFTDGFVEVLPMPTFRHQAILRLLLNAIAALLEPAGGVAMFAPFRLWVRPSKYREPDVLALKDANDPRFGERFWTGADLVVEIVSPDKPERDTVVKRRDYAEGNVPEYWIVNPETETITVLKLDNGAYVEHGVFARGETATSPTLPGFTVNVGPLLDGRSI